mgnify:CR=1 FL=1
MSARSVIIAAIVLAAVAGGGAYYLMSKPADAEAPAKAAPAAADAGGGIATDEAETIVDAYAVEDEEAFDAGIADDETIDETLGELVEGAEIAAEEEMEPGEEFVDVYESAGETFSTEAPPAEEFAESAETVEETIEEPQQ